MKRRSCCSTCPADSQYKKKETQRRAKDAKKGTKVDDEAAEAAEAERKVAKAKRKKEDPYAGMSRKKRRHKQAVIKVARAHGSAQPLVVALNKFYPRQVHARVMPPREGGERSQALVP